MQARALNVLILGATGRTGVLVVREALADGHAVTVWVRDPARLPADWTSQVTVVQGDLHAPEGVATAMASVDAVISAAGHTKGTQPRMMQRLADVLVAGAAGRDTRIISLLGGAVDVPGDGPSSLGRRMMQGVMRLVAGTMLRDAQAHADRLMASGLPVVIARPPRLTDGPKTGRIQAGPFLEMGAAQTLSRADLARFLVDQLHDDRFLRQAPMLHSLR